MGTLTNENPTPLPSAGWRETFFEGFDGAFVDRAAWPIFQFGMSNNGAFQFSPLNVVAFDGEVNVISQVSPGGGWTSGAFSQGWNGQLYGRYEIRARFDEGQGISGAILLWPTDDEGGAEVDLIETRSAERTLNNFTLHATNGAAPSWEMSYDASEWHTYTLDWLPGELVFYLDGVEKLRIEADVPAEPMSLGFLGHVNGPEELWQGGPVNELSPGFAAMHIDWARIYTPEDLWPGTLPGTLYGDATGALRQSTEAWNGAWVVGNFGEYARGAVRSLDGVTYAASWNAAQWNDQVISAVTAPATWQPGLATRLLYGNFVEVRADLRAAGALALQVVAEGAQRGGIATGSGNDRVSWVAHADPDAGTDATMTIVTGAGADRVLVTSPAQTGWDEPFAWGRDWHADYTGRDAAAGLISVARVALGDGDDEVRLLAGSAQVDGGAGRDTVVLDGAASRWTVAALADGSTGVTDATGSMGAVVLWGVEAIRFGGGAEVAAPGQAAFPGAIEITPIGETPPGAGSGNPAAPSPVPAAPVVVSGATAYVGPVAHLELQMLGSEAGEVAAGTARNEFVNLLGGDDAIDAGAGDDVLDGGTGSNFLTGGAGTDTFFLDGRGGRATWGTLTDWQPGEQLSVWGWRPGVSRATFVDSGGTPGFAGVTWHGDLDGDGAVDTSVTWAGLAQAQLPAPVELDGLLWFR